MKNFLSFIFVLAISTQVLFSYSGGSGTSSSPYQISNATDLAELMATTGDWVSGKYFQLSDDIDCTTIVTPVPIGTGPNKFRGNFDGNNKKIYNLTISIPSTNYIAPFGYVGSGAKIYDLGIENSSFTGSSNYGTGGFCGEASGATFTNCYSTATVNGSSSVGGFCGKLHPTASISECYATGNVTGRYNVGGFCGINYYGTISNCYATGNTTTNVRWAGGFCGENRGTIRYCYSTGSVSGTISYGFCGVNYSSGVNYCFWDKETSGKTTSPGGTGKTTAEMMQRSTFVNWNFNDIWGIFENIEYPHLGPPFGAYDTIPTLTEWAAIFMGILLAGFGVFFIFRRMG